MQSVIKKWGNSLALRLPQQLASGLSLTEGATVDISVENAALVIRPTRKRYKLAELLANHKREQTHREVDWGKPEGQEAR
jgi:antitoxin MazE